MAVFQGGRVPVIGVPLSNIRDFASTSSSAAFGNVLGATALSGAVSTLGSTVINVGLSQALGETVSSSLGLNIANGTQILYSQISGYLSSQTNNYINQQLARSLPQLPGFGAAVSSIVSQGVQNIAGSILPGFGSQNTFFGDTGPSKSFPGAGSEPVADYGGAAFTLGPSGGDVVFSIVPAASGPSLLSDPLSSGFSTPIKSGFNQVAGNSGLSGLYSTKIDQQNIDKLYKMQPNTNFSLTTADVQASYWKPTTLQPNFSISGKSNESLFSAFGQASGWSFICSPETIEWTTNAASDRVPIFGTNRPPVVVGTKGMRDLTLGGALVEGFMRNKAIEQKIIALEELFQYTQGKGFVNVPVFHVQANSKKYGGSEGGYFVISELKVKETMRDLRGEATRAFVDVSFMQVPEYQVGSGRDQSSLATNSKLTGALGASGVTNQANQVKDKTAGVNAPSPKVASNSAKVTKPGAAINPLSLPPLPPPPGFSMQSNKP
jgi:hypothetical protein